MRAEEKASSINLAIDKATDSLANQISRFKGKFSKKGKGEPVSAGETVKALPRVKTPRIARVKRFLIQSMSVREAADQMEMLNHDFFLFMNEDTSAMNVIYRRKDGQYGVIEPELEND